MIVYLDENFKETPNTIQGAIWDLDSAKGWAADLDIPEGFPSPGIRTISGEIATIQDELKEIKKWLKDTIDSLAVVEQKNMDVLMDVR